MFCSKQHLSFYLEKGVSLASPLILSIFYLGLICELLFISNKEYFNRTWPNSEAHHDKPYGNGFLVKQLDVKTYIGVSNNQSATYSLSSYDHPFQIRKYDLSSGRCFPAVCTLMTTCSVFRMFLEAKTALNCTAVPSVHIWALIPCC